MIRSDGINTGETRVYHILKYVVVFSAAGLFGPVIRFMIWSPSALMKEARIIYGFIYDLLFLLWPMQALAVMEVSIGRTKAAVLAISANVLLFGIIGLLIAVLAQLRVRTIYIYVALCLLVVWWALWGAGFSLTHFNVYALVVALLFYAVPFYIG